MIERKFRELVQCYLRGEISPAEMSWMVEDLHRKRDRRDQFVEEVEDFLETRARDPRAPSDRNLRELLVRDLSEIPEREVERAMPRRHNPIAAKEIEEDRRRRPSLEEFEEAGAASVPPTTASFGETAERMPFEKPEPVDEDRSYVLPFVGIAILVGTFFLMIRFSSLDSDEADENQSAEPAAGEAISDSEALRRTSEFLEEDLVGASGERPLETDVDAALDDSPAESDDGTGISPVSLADLIGESRIGARPGQTDSTGDELFQIRKPEPEEPPPPGGAPAAAD